MACRNVPVVRLTDLSTLPNHPVIVRGFRPSLAGATIEELLDAVGCTDAWGSRDGDACEYEHLSATEVVRRFNDGSLSCNITDHHVVDPDDRMAIPAVLGADNLLNRTPAMRKFTRCVVVTQRGVYTRPHWDSAGLGGWMYLVQGIKRWHLWNPLYLPVLYDVVNEICFDEVSQPEMSPEYRDVLASVPVWEATLQRGELLYFPESWPHRVWTLENAFGFGGSTLHFERLGQAVEAFLRERRLAMHHPIDYPQLLADLQEEGRDTRSLVDRIKHVFEIWERNREDSMETAGG